MGFYKTVKHPNPSDPLCTVIVSHGRCNLHKYGRHQFCYEHLQGIKGKRAKNTGRECWVYIFDTTFKIGNKTVVKVGVSENTSNRMKDLCSGNPYGVIKIAYLFWGDEARKMEKHIHKFHKRSNIKREFFALTEKELTKLCEFLDKRSDRSEVNITDPTA